MQANLVLVPTPIGNLEDITLRALRVLSECDTILCEDTRTSSVLLKHYNISKPLQSYHAFNEHKALEGLVKRLKNGEKLCLITDAGTPGISDPGFLLARACRQQGIEVSCLPGATACIPALVASGIPCDQFIFEGFLPVKKGRQTALKQLATETRTVILYESPFRIIRTLTDLQEFLGADRIVSVSRELTKKFEETRVGPIHELVAHFTKTEPKGEFVLIISAQTS